MRYRQLAVHMVCRAVTGLGEPVGRECLRTDAWVGYLGRGHRMIRDASLAAGIVFASAGQLFMGLPVGLSEILLAAFVALSGARMAWDGRIEATRALALLGAFW